jgi:hypothetical protein
MAYRQLHDTVPASATLSQLSHFAERLFWRLLSQTDAWGRLPGDRDKIRAVALPRLAVTDADLESALEELVHVGWILLYDVSGVWHCQVVDFEDNQLVARLKRAPSRHPAPPTKRLLDHGSTETGTEDREESVLPTVSLEDPAKNLPVAEAIDQALAIAAGGSSSGFGDRPAGDVAVDDLAALASSLAGSDAGTVKVLRKLRLRGCGEREFATAIESLHHRRSRADRPPLASEVRYVVATLTTMLRERDAVA